MTKFRVQLCDKQGNKWWERHKAVDSMTAIRYYRGQGVQVHDIEGDEDYYSDLQVVFHTTLNESADICYQEDGDYFDAIFMRVESLYPAEDIDMHLLDKIDKIEKECKRKITDCTVTVNLFRVE